MHLGKLIQTTVLTATTISSIFWGGIVQATPFGEKEVEQDKFTAIARPFGDNQYDLLIIEQIPGKQDCWSEVEVDTGTVIIEPLLLNFDFTGICRRNTDSNGYSIRVNGQDLGMDYMLTVVREEDELLLLGVHRSDRQLPPLLIGSTNGLTRGFLKIHLEPGWRFTKRTFEGKVLGHVYLSSTNVQINSQSSGVSQVPNTSVPGAPVVPNTPIIPGAPELPGVASPETEEESADVMELDTPRGPREPTRPTTPTSPTNPSAPTPTILTQPEATEGQETQTTPVFPQ